MKVLITGGYGFIGSHVADRFYKEGYKIVVIDNLSTGSEENVKIKHKFYPLNVADEKCEEVFQTHKIDVIIHLAAQVDVNISNCQIKLDTESNIMGLVNMLHLAQKYKVKKFLFASSAAVYGDTNQVPTPENIDLNPMSIYGVNKAMGEEYLQKWREIYGLDTNVLRLANVYGPRQGLSSEGGVISIFIRKLISGEDLVIYGDGKQTRDYIYVEDVVDAFYKLSQKRTQETIYNVSTNQEHSLQDIIRVLTPIRPEHKITYKKKRKGDIDRSVLDNSRIRQEFNWKPKYSLEDGLKKTVEWFEKNSSEPNQTVKPKPKTFAVFKKVLPYLENFALFGILAFMCGYFLNKSTIISKIGFDYSYFYIIAMGLFYGRRQAFIAAMLSIVLYTTFYVWRGGDLITIMYQPSYILHLLGFLLVGIVTGYTTESRQRQVTTRELELADLKEQHEFVKKMYAEGNQVREELQNQIINYDDSLGKIYHITKDLDSLEKEEVYTAVVQILEKMMKTESVSFYTVNRDETFIRLRHRSAKTFGHQPNSIRIEDHPYLMRVVHKKQFIANKQLEKDVPLMVSPIIYNGKTIALIQIHHMDFANFNLYYENLLRVLTMMITDAIARVSTIEVNLKDMKYLPGTRILKADEFTRILEHIKERKARSDIDYTLISFKVDGVDYVELSWRLSSVVREEDYIGLGPENKIFVLLLNTNQASTKEIIWRIKGALRPIRQMENSHVG